MKNIFPPSIAVIVAHPDDEAIGMGGTLLKFKNLGYKLHFLFMCDGVSARSQESTQKIRRNEEFEAAMDFLKPSTYKALDYPDNKLDTIPFLDIVKEIENFLKDVKPDSIFTHFEGDLNIDHRIVSQAVITGSRPGSDTFVKNILQFEVLSSTDRHLGAKRFNPNHYVDITQFIDAKINYLKNYQSEMREFPHARSYENIVALSHIRGAEIFTKNAEGFLMMRSVLDDK
ncbi:MAG: PIG-L family deacetylase [Alphaproteobacteria bacterium]|nr:PIG-L family deacetylase [Alphaproteobacteria bacterium]